jgi:signal transduction histidine kinase
LVVQRDLENKKRDFKKIKNIQDSLDVFYKHHILLLRDRGSQSSLSDLNSEVTQKIYQETEYHTELFISETKNFLKQLDDKKRSEAYVKSLGTHADVVAHLATETLLPQLDALTYERSRQATLRLIRIGNVQTILFIVFVSVLLLQAFFLYIPTAKRRRESLTELLYMHEHEKERQKFSALGEVSAKIVHEINNPLTAIIGRVEILLKNKDKKFDEQTITTFAGIKQNLWRISRTIKLTKMIYRNGKNDPVTIFDLKKVIVDMTETTQMLQNMSPIHFISSLEEGHYIEAQEHQIFQVMTNVVSNAIDATREIPAPTISLELVADHKHAIFRVTDNGPGVPEELYEKIFEKLYTTKKEGTGIGLYEARQMLEALGGSLELNTTISKSCFEIKVPLCLACCRKSVGHVA